MSANRFWIWTIPFLAAITTGTLLFAGHFASQYSARPSWPLSYMQHSRLQHLPPKFSPGKYDAKHAYRKAVIIASIKEEDTSWAYEKLHDMDVYRYVNDDPTANLTVPMNKGNEVMSYLTFLIDFYDKLPDVMIFVHAHEYTHHNPEIFGRSTPVMLNALRTKRVVEQGYMHLHCGQWVKHCEVVVQPAAGKPYWGFPDIWREFWPQYEVPDILAQSCCGQFALSRERALQIPREEFIRLRQTLLDTKHGMGYVGHIWEYFWQFIFMSEHILCPDMRKCYCDGYGYCFERTKERDAWSELNSIYHGLQALWDEQNRMERVLQTQNDDRRTPDQEHRFVRLATVMDDLWIATPRLIEEARLRGTTKDGSLPHGAAEILDALDGTFPVDMNMNISYRGTV